LRLFLSHKSNARGGSVEKELTFETCLQTRLARWYIFRPKIEIWINLGGSCNRRCWYILLTFGIFYGHLKYFMDIWYSLCEFGIWCWYIVPRKIWQPCSRYDCRIIHSRLIYEPTIKINVCRLLKHFNFQQGCQMPFFKPKIQTWVNFGGSCNGSWWYVYIMYICYTLWTFGIYILW
jgi:hypothetical protein